MSAAPTSRRCPQCGALHDLGGGMCGDCISAAVQQRRPINPPTQKNPFPLPWKAELLDEQDDYILIEAANGREVARIMRGPLGFTAVELGIARLIVEAFSGHDVAESWRANALAMEGAVNAMSEKNNRAAPNTTASCEFCRKAGVQCVNHSVAYWEKKAQAAEYEIENLCEELEQAKRTAKEERTLRLAAQASADAWRANHERARLCGALSNGKTCQLPENHVGNAHFDATVGVWFVPHKHFKTLEELNAAALSEDAEVKAAYWEAVSESWRHNAIAMEGAMNAQSERHTEALRRLEANLSAAQDVATETGRRALRAETLLATYAEKHDMTCDVAAGHGETCGECWNCRVSFAIGKDNR